MWWVSTSYRSWYHHSLVPTMSPASLANVYLRGCWGVWGATSSRSSASHASACAPWVWMQCHQKRRMPMRRPWSRMLPPVRRKNLCTNLAQGWEYTWELDRTSLSFNLPMCIIYIYIHIEYLEYIRGNWSVINHFCHVKWSEVTAFLRVLFSARSLAGFRFFSLWTLGSLLETMESLLHRTCRTVSACPKMSTSKTKKRMALNQSCPPTIHFSFCMGLLPCVQPSLQCMFHFNCWMRSWIFEFS